MELGLGVDQNWFRRRRRSMKEGKWEVKGGVEGGGGGGGGEGGREGGGGWNSLHQHGGWAGRQGGGLVDTLLPSSSLPTTSFPDSSCLYHPAKSHLMVKAPESRSPKYSCRKEPPEGFRFWLRRLCWLSGRWLVVPSASWAVSCSVVPHPPVWHHPAAVVHSELATPPDFDVELSLLFLQCSDENFSWDICPQHIVSELILWQCPSLLKRSDQCPKIWKMWEYLRVISDIKLNVTVLARQRCPTSYPSYPNPLATFRATWLTTQLPELILISCVKKKSI